MKKLLSKLWAWFKGEVDKKVKVDRDVKPTPSDVVCACGALGDVVEIPALLRGGECVMPFGLDIRFDGNYEKLTGKGFHFVGNAMKDACKVSRNSDGTYRVSCNCKTFQAEGVKAHVYGYNFPTDKVPIVTGSVCESWNRNGTFRWYVLFYKI